jgi:hypothetical protein
MGNEGLFTRGYFGEKIPENFYLEKNFFIRVKRLNVKAPFISDIFLYFMLNFVKF